MNIALIFVLARTLIRLRLQKRLFIDDAFLFVGAMCLCTNVVLVWRFSNGIFAEEKVLNDSSEFVLSPEYVYTFIEDKIGGVYIILTYITIYFVKLSFLFFFRTLVRRDRKMMRYWWTVLVIIILALFISSVIAVVPLCEVYRTPHGTV